MAKKKTPPSSKSKAKASGKPRGSNSSQVDPAKRIQKIAKSGRDVREKVRDLTLEMIHERQLKLDDLATLAEEIMNGAVAGVKSSLPASRRSVLHQVVTGISDAWATTAVASEHALQHARRYGLRFTQRDLSALSDRLMDLERRFVETVSDSADRLQGDLRNEVGNIVDRVRKAGTEIKPAAQQAQRAISGHLRELAGEVTVTGIAVSKKAISSTLLATSGLLEGVGKALSTSRNTKRKPR